MTDQQFQVVLTNKDYNQLKEQKNINVKLMQKMVELGREIEFKNIHQQQLEKQIQTKQLQIAFLVNLFYFADQNFSQNQSFEFQSIKSNSYEILGQSIIREGKVDLLDFNDLKINFQRKYDNIVKKIQDLKMRLDAHEELISNLNEVNDRQKQTIMENSLQREKMAKKEVESLIDQSKMQISQKDKLIQSKLNQVERCKTRIDQLLAESDNLKRSKSVLQKQNSKWKQDCSSLKSQISHVTELIKAYSEKNKKLQAQMAQVKKSVVQSSAESCGEKAYKIKLMIDEHIKEVESNLRNIGGLQDIEIQQLLLAEVKGIADYIPKAIQSNKK